MKDFNALSIGDKVRVTADLQRRVTGDAAGYRGQVITIIEIAGPTDAYFRHNGVAELIYPHEVDLVEDDRLNPSEAEALKLQLIRILSL